MLSDTQSQPETVSQLSFTHPIPSAMVHKPKSMPVRSTQSMDKSQFISSLSK